MKALISIFCLLLATTSFAATAVPVSYPSGDQSIQGLLYLPSGSGAHPAIVVIHESFGD